MLSPTPALPAVTPKIAPEIAPENEQTSSISPSLQHEVLIQQVKPGQEMATFSARLTDATFSLARDVVWQVRSAEGQVVLNQTATTAAVALPPGNYVVEARFGAVRLKESFTLPEGNSLTLNFVLNAGAVRILPRIRGISSPAVASQSRIFALSGEAKGRMVQESATPGEIINLTAGEYRIESRLLMGNTVAVTDVKIKPGIMSAVEIDHRAGLARLSYVGAPNAKVEWQIRRGETVEVGAINGLSANVALKPGDYVATARVGSEELTASFRIDEGQERDIMLGN